MMNDCKEQKPIKNIPVRITSSKRTPPTQLKSYEVKNTEFPKHFYPTESEKAQNLVTTMAHRLKSVKIELENINNELKEAKQTIKEKELCISKLKKNMIKKSISSATSSIKENFSLELPDEFYKLQFKVLDMERFLFDFCAMQAERQKKIEEDDKLREIEYKPDIDYIIEIIRSMNLENSEPQIIHTDQGARLQICDVVELTLYANGMISGDTPFRPYSYSSVQAYFRDMQDGFYPSELQENNPEGVIFKVNDKREEVYQPLKKIPGVFGGHGIKVGRVPLKPNINSTYEELWNPLSSVVDNNDVNTEKSMCKKNFVKDTSDCRNSSKTLTVLNGVIKDDPLRNLKTVPLSSENAQSVVVNKLTNKKNKIKLKVKGYQGEPVYIVYVLIQDTINTLHNILLIDGVYTLAYRDEQNKIQYLSEVNATFKSYGICQNCMLFAVRH